MMRSLREDLYTVVGQIDPQSKRATFQFHVNPLVSWIWVGLLILMTGTITSLFPELSFGEVGAWSYVRAGAGVAAGTAFALWIAMAPSMAYAHERPVQAHVGPQLAGISEATLAHRLPSSGFGLAGFAGLALGSVVSLARRRRDNANSSRD
jgi:cytochrome c-type biogenesis protein CcmF